MDVLTAVEVDQYALAGVAVDVQFQTVDANGEPATGTTPTVAVVDGLGEAVTVGAVSEVGSGTGLYQATIAAGDNTTVTELTVTWAVSGVNHVRRVSVLGRWPFTFADLRAFDKSVENKAGDAFLTARRETMSELMGMCPKSPVPMFGIARLWQPSGYEATLPHRHVTTIHAVAEIDPDGTETAYSASELADLAVSEHGTLFNRGAYWSGYHDLKVTYTHGAELPPQYLKRAMMLRCVWHLNQQSSNLMERVTSWSTGEGGTYRYDNATATKTGMPNVDGAYKRWAGPNYGFG